MKNTAPLQVTYHGLEHSQALTEYVSGEAEKLTQYFSRITFCRVVIDRPNHRRRHGDQYAIHIEIGVPRQLLVVRHEPTLSRGRWDGDGEDRPRAGADRGRADAYLAVRDAFVAARRRLEDYARQLRAHNE